MKVFWEKVLSMAVYFWTVTSVAYVGAIMIGTMH